MLGGSENPRFIGEPRHAQGREKGIHKYSDQKILSGSPGATCGVGKTRFQQSGGIHPGRGYAENQTNVAESPRCVRRSSHKSLCGVIRFSANVPLVNTGGGIKHNNNHSRVPGAAGVGQKLGSNRSTKTTCTPLPCKPVLGHWTFWAWPMGQCTTCRLEIGGRYLYDSFSTL